MTRVPSGAGVKANVVWFVAAKGLMNSSLMPTIEGFAAFSMLIFPSPTSSFPFHM